ncbi:hypothetical protein GCM10023200_24190 [Actinomycetospora chlora]|uniref:Uncharacterized protein n=1 Tax=Actinomycetospora chlora TaxID=663608 RepID=A0ABP9B2T1_9PSEU
MTDDDQSSSVATAPPSRREDRRDRDRRFTGPAAPGASGRTSRWGPAWVGALVAGPVFVVLQLLFIAFGWIGFGVRGVGTGAAASIVSALLAIIALFLGGLAGGAASPARDISVDTTVQGAMTWALTAGGLLGLGLFGGGAVAGNLGALSGLVLATGPPWSAADPAVVFRVVEAVRAGAGWAALWLGVAFLAAVVGTGLGAGLTAGAGRTTPG